MNSGNEKEIYHQGFIDALTFTSEYNISCQNVKLPKDDEAIVVNVNGKATAEELQILKDKLKEFFKTNRILIINTTEKTEIETKKSKQKLFE